jgi:amino acid transporter
MLVLIAQFWTGFAPVGWEALSASERASSFFRAYLAAPVVIIFYLSYKIYHGTTILKARDMDLFTGKREFNVRSLVAEEKADRQAWPAWKKVYKFLC